MNNLQEALSNPIWINHKIGDTYEVDGNEGWKIAYYPIFEDGVTLEPYSEPRVLIEKPALFNGIRGIDFREIPLRFLDKCGKKTR